MYKCALDQSTESALISVVSSRTLETFFPVQHSDFPCHIQDSEKTLAFTFSVLKREATPKDM